MRDQIETAIDALPDAAGTPGRWVARGLIRVVSLSGGASAGGAEIPGATARLVVEPTLPEAERPTLEAALRALPGTLPGLAAVEIAHATAVPDLGGAARPAPRELAGVGHVIAVGAGKGGVGKSSVTANLAVALAQQGLSVGLIDADIFGFSIPGLMGLSRDGMVERPTRVDDLMLPPVAHGVKVISIGMFLGDKDPRNTAVSWRGPMLHRTIEQFLRDVWFGDLDVLLLDLPPGTGDIAISVGQLLPQAEVVVVTTPQAAAADVAVRSALVARQTGQRVIGVIENMAGLAQPDGTVLEIFGSGGGKAVAERLSEPVSTEDQPRAERPEPVALLGSIALSPEFRAHGDEGVPAVVAAPNDPASRELTRIAGVLASMPRGLRGASLPLSLG